MLEIVIIIATMVTLTFAGHTLGYQFGIAKEQDRQDDIRNQRLDQEFELANQAAIKRIHTLTQEALDALDGKTPTEVEAVLAEGETDLKEAAEPWVLAEDVSFRPHRSEWGE